MAWVANDGYKYGVKVTFVKDASSNTSTKASRTYNGINIGGEASTNPTQYEVFNGISLLFPASVLNNAVIPQIDLITTDSYVPGE